MLSRCTYDVLVSGPGDPVRVELDGSADLAPGAYTATFMSSYVSDAVGNGQATRTPKARCSASLTVANAPVTAIATFSSDGCTVQVSPAAPEPSEEPATAPAPTATATPVDTSSLRYICDQFPFAAAVLEEQRFDELADRPEAAALRSHLAAQPAADELLPRAGWTLVGANSGAAEYVARRGDGTFANVVLRHRVSWEVIGFGGCSPVLRLADGSGAGTWAGAPGQAIGPETTTFDALVTERACASGKSADGRIVGPTAFYGDEVVVVVFGVRPLPTGQDCPSNPSTRVTVTLDEPLGDRRLLDGSVLPHREPEPEF